MSIEEIIAKVKARPELWQTAHPFYKHRFVTTKIWLEIAEELNIEEAVLRKKWKHLKDQHRKEQKKILANTIARSYWQHYDSLVFLSEDYQRQLAEKTKAEATATEATEESDDDKKSNSDSDERPLKAKRPRKILKTLKPASLRPKLPLHKTQEVADINAFVTKSPDAGKLNFILSRLSSMEAAIENCNTPSEDTSKNNSDYMFILSLLPIMKKLTEIQKLQFRGKMNDWLLEIVTQNEYSEGGDYKVFLQNQIGNENPPSE